MRLVGQLALAQSRVRSKAVSSAVEGCQPSATCFGRVDYHRVSRVSYCGYHGSTPCSGSACCRSVGVYCDVGLRFPNQLLTYICSESLLEDYAFRVYLPGTHASPGAINLVSEGSLEVIVWGSSFTAYWAAERQPCRTRR